MKKIIVPFSIFLFAFCFINIKSVEAKSCTGTLYSPPIPQLEERMGHLRSLTTSANTCLGSNTEMWFSNFHSLPSSYTIHAQMALHIRLMEDDPDGNQDEYVKKYLGTFNGRILTDISLQTVVTSGNIDSVGDNVCELYPLFSMSGNWGGPVTQERLFDYEMCMK